jgi:hypothetical protein
MSKYEKIFRHPIIDMPQKHIKSSKYLVEYYTESETPSDSAKIWKIRQQIHYTLEGLTNLVYEYDKLIDVYKNRANQIPIQFNLKDKSKSDPTLQRALITIYGTYNKILTLNDYIELTNHEHGIIGTATAQAIVTPFQNVEDITKTSDIINNPSINAIKHIKNTCNNILNENNWHEFTIVNLLIKKRFYAASEKSRLIVSAEIVDPDLEVDFNIDFNNSENTIREKLDKDSWRKEGLIAECFPCLDRSLNMLDDYLKSRFFVDFVNYSTQSFLSQAQQLALFKLYIAKPGLDKTLCSLINAFSKRICLPDLGAFISFLKMILNSKKLQLKTNFKLSPKNLAIDLSNLLVKSILDGLLAVAMKALRGVIPTMHCVLSSLTFEFNKIGTVLDELNLGEDFTKSNINKISNKAYEHINTPEKLLNNLHRDLRSIEDSITNWITSVTQDWQLNIGNDEEALDLYKNINEYTYLWGALTEIYGMGEGFFRTFLDTGKVDLNSLCNNIHSGEPWVTIIPLPSQEELSEAILDLFRPVDIPTPEPGITLPEDINDDSDDEDPPSPVPPEAIPETPETTDSYIDEEDVLDALFQDLITVRTGYYLADSSIPGDFFDGVEIDEIIEDDFFQNIIYPELIYQDNLENGENPLKLDIDFIKIYKTMKKASKQLKNNAINLQEYNSLISLGNNFLVTKVISTQNCLENIDGFNQEEINQWITRIKK